MRGIQIVILFTLMLLAGCLPLEGITPTATQAIEPVACSDIVDPKILVFPWEDIMMDGLHAWVITNYPDAVIQDKQISQDFVQIGWMIGEERYNVYFEDRVRLFYPVLSSRPSIADLLRCYGEPTYYNMEYVPAPEAAAIRFEIWYPNRGLRFVSEEYSSWRLKTTFDKRTRVHTVDILPPGTMEEMLQSWTLHNEIVDRVLAGIQPWPEDFEVIEYTGEFRWGR